MRGAAAFSGADPAPRPWPWLWRCPGSAVAVAVALPWQCRGRGVAVVVAVPWLWLRWCPGGAVVVVVQWPWLWWCPGGAVAVAVPWLWRCCGCGCGQGCPGLPDRPARRRTCLPVQYPGLAQFLSVRFEVFLLTLVKTPLCASDRRCFLFWKHSAGPARRRLAAARSAFLREAAQKCRVRIWGEGDCAPRAAGNTGAHVCRCPHAGPEDRSGFGARVWCPSL